MEVPFRKVQGLGNDFVVIDEPWSSDWLTPERARQLCDRNFGVGADGVLAVLPGDEGLRRMKIYNADGSVPEMCGNGIRCFARHLVDHLGWGEPEVAVDTDAGLLTCRLLVDADGAVEGVRVAMGAPTLAASSIPVRAGVEPTALAYEVDGVTYEGRAVSMGNPHAVLFVDHVDEELATRVGKALVRHPDFPEGVNVELAQILAADRIRVIVWERGVGLTLACGTGACATAVAACQAGLAPFGTPITVALPGGDATVEVAPDLSQVWLTGPATEVFAGTLAAR